MSKRMMALILCLIFAATVFQGCGNTNQASGTEASAAAKAETAAKTETQAAETPKEVKTISFWFPGADKVNDEYFKNAAQAFQEKNPGVKIDTTILPANAMDIDVKLNAAQMSGTYPDVLSAYLVYMGTRGTKGEFADLTTYFDAWEDKSDLFESAVEMGKVGGKVMGIAFYPAPEIMVYRKDYFKEAGLDPEKPPKSWEELAQYARKLVKKDASGKVVRAGFDLPAINSYLMLMTFMKQAGSTVVDEKGGMPSFTDAAAVSATEFLVGLKDQSIPYDYQKKEDIPFMKGNAAISTLQTTQITKLLGSDIKDQIGFVVPLIANKTNTTFCGQRLFVVGKDSKAKAEAFEFIKFMMGKDQMLQRAKDLGIPVGRKSLEADYVKMNPTLNPVIIAYVKAGQGMPIVVWAQVFGKHLNNAFQEAYAGGKKAEQALKDADTALKKEIESFNKK